MRTGFTLEKINGTCWRGIDKVLRRLKMKFYSSLFLIKIIKLGFIIACLLTVQCSDGKYGDKPNFIIIFCDDMGYQDLSCYGSLLVSTPHIDQLAQQGMKFTDFYVGQSICTPSRSALLTGCYPRRVGMHVGVIFSPDSTGLHPNEVTLAELLKQQGYATACIGKWHLGHADPKFLPTAQGFDSYFGLPYSNDMMQTRPDLNALESLDQAWKNPAASYKWWNVPLMRNEQIIEQPVDQRTLTNRYTKEAISFIKAHKSVPFFLYLAHTMPHVPLYVPDNRYNPDPHQAYKLTVEHIDSSTGEIIKLLRELDLDRKTIVVFTSDNGPWLEKQHHAGNALPLRDGKFTTYEGGFRVPCVVWAPGLVPAGNICREMASTMDLFTTFVIIAEGKIPEDRIIDGKDILPLMKGEVGVRTPHNNFFFFSSSGELEGIRQGKWKLRRTDGYIELYNLEQDVSEENNLARENPERVEKLLRIMEDFSTDLEKTARPIGSMNDD
jgi:arylsulfatase A